MKRREFITLIGGAAAWPLAARAQQSKVARIGVLYIGLADAESFKKELRDGLRELGYVEGQNIAFEFRSAEGKQDRLPELASELVRLTVDVIVALYVPSALAAKQATREMHKVTNEVEWILDFIRVRCPCPRSSFSRVRSPTGNADGSSPGR